MGDIASPVFVHMRPWTPAYEDLRRLVELAGFSLRHLDEIDLDREQTVVFFVFPDDVVSRLPPPGRRGARIVLWNIERAFLPVTGGFEARLRDEWLGIADEVWLSDPHYARLMQSPRARFVLMASDHRLGRPPRAPARWDLVHLGYPTERRVALLDRLADVELAPSEWGEKRAAALTRTRLLASIHQDEFPIMAPLRIAIAAAFQLPVLSERVVEIPAGHEAVEYAEYDDLAPRIRAALRDPDELRRRGERLHRALCVETDFRREVLRATQNAGL